MKGIGIYNETFFVIKEDTSLLKDHVRRIIATGFGERVGNIEFGSNLKKYIFENEKFFLEDVQENLTRNIEDNEPNVSVDEILLEKEDVNYYSILLRCINKNTGEDGVSVEMLMLTD